MAKRKAKRGFGSSPADHDDRSSKWVGLGRRDLKNALQKLDVGQCSIAMRDLMLASMDAGAAEAEADSIEKSDTRHGKGIKASSKLINDIADAGEKVVACFRRRK